MTYVNIQLLYHSHYYDKNCIGKMRRDKKSLDTKRVFVYFWFKRIHILKTRHNSNTYLFISREESVAFLFEAVNTPLTNDLNSPENKL